MDRNKLFVVPKPISKPKIRLFCFPFAGGTVTPYTSWPHLLSEKVEVVLIQFPGRGSRITEDPHQNIVSMIDELNEHADFITELPYILFGHSFGSRVAFELCCRLYSKGYQLPMYLIASASRAAHLPLKSKPIQHYSNRDFITNIVGVNNIPREVLSNENLMKLLLPVLRADFSIAGSYTANEIKMPFPILALYGKEDSGVLEGSVDEWHKLTSIHFKKVQIPGGHFFLNQYRDLVLTQISNVIEIAIGQLS